MKSKIIRNSSCRITISTVGATTDCTLLFILEGPLPRPPASAWEKLFTIISVSSTSNARRIRTTSKRGNQAVLFWNFTIALKRKPTKLFCCKTPPRTSHPRSPHSWVVRAKCYRPDEGRGAGRQNLSTEVWGYKKHLNNTMYSFTILVCPFFDLWR